MIHWISQLPPQVQQLIQRCEQWGKICFPVGGWVRDRLLGHQPTDWDFVTNLSAEQLILLASQSCMTVVSSIPKLQIFKVSCEGFSFDLARMRREQGPFRKRMPRSVQFVDRFEEDTLRRDFTINALALDYSGTVVDFCGGLDDLRQHRLRLIGDPKSRVQEDPLRALRGLRLAHRLNFQIEQATMQALSWATLTDLLLGPALAHELFKILEQTGLALFECYEPLFSQLWPNHDWQMLSEAQSKEEQVKFLLGRIKSKEKE